MRRRKAQKKLKHRQLTVCQKCLFKPFDPATESKPWNMTARLINEGGTKGWIVVKTCNYCKDKVLLR